MLHGLIHVSIVCVLLISAIPRQMAAQSAPDCPPPPVEQNDWRAVTIESCGIRLRLPTRYKEKRAEIIVGDHRGASFRAGEVDRVTISVQPTAHARLEDNTIVRQSDYERYSECAETIGGRDAIVQSFRGGGVVLSGSESSAPFHASAIWEYAPGQILRIDATSATQRSQHELLAIVRTVEFSR